MSFTSRPTIRPSRQDLEDMVESIANIVRAWPAERLRDGQPYRRARADLRRRARAGRRR